MQIVRLRNKDPDPSATRAAAPRTGWTLGLERGVSCGSWVQGKGSTVGETVLSCGSQLFRIPIPGMPVGPEAPVDAAKHSAAGELVHVPQALPETSLHHFRQQLCLGIAIAPGACQLLLDQTAQAWPVSMILRRPWPLRRPSASGQPKKRRHGAIGNTAIITIANGPVSATEMATDTDTGSTVAIEEQRRKGATKTTGDEMTIWTETETDTGTNALAILAMKGRTSPAIGTDTGRGRGSARGTEAPGTRHARQRTSRT